MTVELGTLVNCPVCGTETRKEWPYMLCCSSVCARDYYD